MEGCFSYWDDPSIRSSLTQSTLSGLNLLIILHKNQEAPATAR